MSSFHFLGEMKRAHSVLNVAYSVLSDPETFLVVNPPHNHTIVLCVRYTNQIYWNVLSVLMKRDNLIAQLKSPKNSPGKYLLAAC